MRGVYLIACFAGFAGLLWGGCGHDALPAPTSKPVTPLDVAGTWRLDLDSPKATVLLDFRPDGTFTETISRPEGPAQACPGGRWSVRGPYVDLANYASVSGLHTGSISWYVIDQIGGGRALFGGDFPDPDSFRPLRRDGDAPATEKDRAGAGGPKP